MFYFSICLIIWLFLGFITGLDAVLLQPKKEFEENWQKAWDMVGADTTMSRPKNPKGFFMALMILLGGFAFAVHIVAKFKNIVDKRKK